ncbi:septum formation initiator family protein [Tessaracoccus sp. HDW20]|uniref:FtsB family cell division protein n=1 Tax=Tessaracoccus coleopterorum TaxID=2714950 RepID=UPI0018D324D8|nr:septum formation initiator family protein [Tessaracoccus coleopterorum]NHB84337.1 septum formation initiator family protein [Tessaracoccus coleopterorum]
MTATWRLAVLVVVIAGVSLVLANSLRVYFAQANELAEVRAQIAEEQDRIADLEDKLNRWNDDEYVKSIARVRLGWVMPGEVGYHVIGADGLPLEGATMEQTVEEPPGQWWEQMWRSVQLADDPTGGTEEPVPGPTPPQAPPIVSRVRYSLRYAALRWRLAAFSSLGRSARCDSGRRPCDASTGEPPIIN